MNFDRHTELQLLEALEEEPETSQADLAARVGVAVGTVNWYIKRWSKKGMVKVKRIGRWRWNYILTPQGITEKTVLAKEYFEASMSIYRQTRSEARELIGEVKGAGYRQVAIDGDGDIADICRLTCLELDVAIDLSNDNETNPVLRPVGSRIDLIWPVIEAIETQTKTTT